MSEWSDKFEDTKGVIRSYESKKDSQYNYRTKMVNDTNNDLQITKPKTIKIEQHEHHKKKQCDLRFSGMERSSCSTCGKDYFFDEIGP
jgi:hypothetical protein